MEESNDLDTEQTKKDADIVWDRDNTRAKTKMGSHSDI